VTGAVGTGGRGDVTWPAWPQSTAEVERAVVSVLRSGRWAISGMSTGAPSQERRFGEAFARFHDVRYAVPVSHGSAALTVALEALGVGYGDEVLVPGLVWVACASAVARVGAIPVLVDVEEETFCMSPSAAEAAVTERTRAILLVHLYSSVADLDAFGALAERCGLWLLEDCAQAHGAAWRGRRVGSFGAAAAFSFQNSKLLTAGEGGIVITSDEKVYEAAQQLRADGRQWSQRAAGRGFPDLDEVGGRQGHNHCMTEMQAAILEVALASLDDQNRRRLANVELFERAIEAIDGVEVVRRRDDRVTTPTFYHVPVRIDPDAFAGASGERVGQAVAEATGLYLEPVDPPLDAHPLYRPGRYGRFSDDRRAVLDAKRSPLPTAAALSQSCFTIPHHAFLASPRHMEILAQAIADVRREAARL
jgi:dTDP-4-amino-4,6-dideoxygalactose transaminase